MSLPATRPQTLLAADDGQEEQQFLTFVLNEESYAIGILHIKEILECGGLTQVPMMPAFIRGVINLRGAVVPVVDMSVRFGQQHTKVSKRTCIVIVEVAVDDHHQDIGLMVDSVSEVLEIHHQDMEPPPRFGTRIRSDFIEAMGKVNDEFVIILDVNRVLSIDELAAASAVVESSES